MKSVPLSQKNNLELPFAEFASRPAVATGALDKDLERFREFGQKTRTLSTRFLRPDGAVGEVPTFVNEFWTARQRQASSLHEVSYRACFKPQLPRFFIERLTNPGAAVYDPFMGRGTTPIEAALLDRVPIGNDANPLSIVMTRPRLCPPSIEQVAERLKSIPLDKPADTPEDLHAFYHPKTLRNISSLKNYILKRKAAGDLDFVDEWIALVALNRLTGHSSGFFSAYTLPPNQAVSVRSQLKINEKRKQTPPERDVVKIIQKKTKQLLGDVDDPVRARLAKRRRDALFLTGPAAATPGIPSNSVTLVVTSPPFLNVVQYATDNWLRCWFLGIDVSRVKLTVPTKLEQWRAVMLEVFKELHRLLKPGGHIAFEVGEVHGGKTKLEETVLPSGEEAGLEPLLVVINDQEFTKTANCWGVDNGSKGTNTNRIVVFRKS
ncbi:MAG TPA: DNA methyltransferase [Verrucomicrobiae bacterium]|nr:DNA methyltransferase [Verrucomicrobiae bacterium]